MLSEPARLGRWGALLIVVAVAAGCSGKPEQAVDPNVFPSRYRNEVSQFMRTHLSNPKNIRDAYISEPQLKPVAGSTRYVSCVRYNARAANDVYMGSKDSMAIFFAGDITQFLDATKEVCGSVAWQKFSELEQVVP